MTLRIGVPTEVKAGENRVAVTPAGAAAIRKAGGAVVVQSGAGAGSGFPDDEYAAAGATLVRAARDAWDVDLVVKVKEPLESEFRFLAEGTALFAYLHLAAVPALARALLARKVTAIAYETVAEGGRLPLLHPMSEVAGVLAVQEGARGLMKINGGRGILLTAVGNAPPGAVCILGAGTAGINAARTAIGLGAYIAVLDDDPKKLEYVRKEFGRKAKALLATPKAVAAEVAAADLVISSVHNPGERAPVLVTRGMLSRMKEGSVVVDIAIDQGGSVETSRPTTHANPFFVEEGIVHYCVTNMPGAVPRTSTIALTGATLPFVEKIARAGVLGALRADAALRAGLNTHGGRVGCEGVARVLGTDFTPPDRLVGQAPA